MNKKFSYKFGIFAEYFVVVYLTLLFYSIVSRRYKTKVGEVDIIARRGDSLVFVEVKARKSRAEVHSSLTVNQQGRIVRAAQLFLAKNPKYSQSNIRFDLILLCPSFYLRHIKNAWYA